MFRVSTVLLCVLFCTVMFVSSCKKDQTVDSVTVQTGPNPIDSTQIDTTITGCNLHESLCDKRYNEVVYVTTHNAFNYESGPNPFQLPNQSVTISQQLADGVRGLMIDVHLYNGTEQQFIGHPFVYHSFSALGEEPFVSNLDEIRTFLLENPKQVVTIILECYVTVDLIEWAVQQAQIEQLLFSKNPTSDWPTLQTMIDSNQRLVIFSDCNDGSALDWYHYVWDYCVETEFSNSEISDFTCDFNRGDPGNDLFILNHFLTDPVFGTGDKTRSEEANANPYILSRAQECQATTGKLPNFLTVDFHDIGDVFEAVDSLNGVY